MSKTFKSTLGTTELELSGYAQSHAGLFISAEDGEELAGFYFDQSDAPALALAILESAGYTEDDTEVGPRKNLVATDYSLGMRYLRFGIEEQLRKSQANKEAEAKDKAKLETEALELYNACMGHNLTSFNGLGGALRDQWLAVARAAREMAGKRAEK